MSEKEIEALRGLLDKGMIDITGDSKDKICINTKGRFALLEQRLHKIEMDNQYHWSHIYGKISDVKRNRSMPIIFAVSMTLAVVVLLVKVFLL